MNGLEVINVRDLHLFPMISSACDIYNQISAHRAICSSKLGKVQCCVTVVSWTWRQVNEDGKNDEYFRDRLPCYAPRKRPSKLWSVTDGKMVPCLRNELGAWKILKGMMRKGSVKVLERPSLSLHCRHVGAGIPLWFSCRRRSQLCGNLGWVAGPPQWRGLGNCWGQRLDWRGARAEIPMMRWKSMSQPLHRKLWKPIWQ